MANQKFDIKDALDFGWAATRANFLFLWLATILGYAAYAVPNISAEYFQKSIPPFSLLMYLGSFFLYFLVKVGWIRISLHIVDQQKSGVEELFSNSRIVWRFFCAAFLCSLAILGGLILLIVPGIYMMIRLVFSSYLIVDQGLRPFEALRRSWEMTKGQEGRLFLFGLTFFGVNVLGFLCLFIGLFWTVPLTMLAQAYVYRKFSPATVTNG